MAEQGKAGESLLSGLGASALQTYRVAGALLITFISAWKSSSAPGLGAREVCRAITVRQIFYTGFQALSIISLVALFVGATLTAQAEILGGPLQRETTGRVLVTIIVRELAPLITAVIVAGRSGTAIVTEIGVMRMNSEILALASLGVDPPRLIVWPRIVSTTVSVPLLTVYFSTMAVLGGFLSLFVIDSHAVAEWRSGAVLGLSIIDLPLVLIKTVGLGALIGWLCSYYGFEVGSSPTEVPQKASRAVVQSLIACIIYNAIITLAFYGLLVGGRLQ